MMSQTDSALARQADILDNVQSLSPGNLSGGTDYYLQQRDAQNRIMGVILQPVFGDGCVSEPDLPADGEANGEPFGQAFTVNAVTVNCGSADLNTQMMAKSSWRVVKYAWHSTSVQGRSTSSGIVYIALSLNSVINTANAITRYFLIVSIIILTLGVSLGALAFSQTLSSLKKIEKAAAKIAAGDLSARVPALPVNTEIGSLAASLNTMLEQIEASFKQQEATTDKMKQFVSDASHELRTPLAAIHGYAELYSMQRRLPGNDDRADDVIRRIENSSSRMTSLVEDLLSLARLDEGRGVDISQPLNVKTALSDSVFDLYALDPERKVTLGRLQAPAFDIFIPGQLPDLTIQADGNRIRQVFTNIVGNIHRYTPKDSPVEVSLNLVSTLMQPKQVSTLPLGSEGLTMFLRSVSDSLVAKPPVRPQQTRISFPLPGRSSQSTDKTDKNKTGNSDESDPKKNMTDYAFIRFTDHGPGVKPQALVRLFERFYTDDPSRARAKGGTGLGMAITQSVVKAHSGYVCASPTKGGGLTITIIFPTKFLPLAA
jgi:two-component system OmpR family sensor kinase